ncbi:MAG TPA: glycerophosphodiester phosphodiesterase [Kofleriaceae bacterium]|nr:glycerophosphodiester phosphodiesterase [Kofleriaceae bacterium]
MPKLAVARLVPHFGRLGRAERWKRATRARPRIWAHRGASAHAPENTLAAFELAKSAGADGIELDVMLDRDANVVVFHDHELTRLCGRPGRMEELGASVRKELRVQGEPVPLLADVFDMLGDLEINVEIKVERVARAAQLVKETANVIRRSGRAEQVLVSSFDPIALVQFHRYMPDIALAYLFAQEQGLPIRRGWVGQWIGASVVHPDHRLCTKQMVKAWHTAGMPINAWTVDDEAELRRLDDLGVDGVFTNDPARALAAFG